MVQYNINDMTGLCDLCIIFGVNIDQFCMLSMLKLSNQMWMPYLTEQLLPVSAEGGVEVQTWSEVTLKANPSWVFNQDYTVYFNSNILVEAVKSSWKSKPTGKYFPVLLIFVWLSFISF